MTAMSLQRRQLLRLAGLATAASVSRRAAADAYPSRPVRWIVPFPAGGSTDIVTRIMCDWLSQRLGQQFVVENKPGGGTNIATEAAAHATPDGYTLLLGLATHAINPSLYRSLPFNFLKDFTLIAGLGELPLVLDGALSLPARNPTEFIAYARTNPGKVNVASFGTRTISHLAIELLKMSTGIDVVHVPYTGGAPMLTDLFSGRVQAGMDALPNSLPHIKSGTIRGLAILSAKRSPALPDTPTMGETIPGYDVTPWSAVAAPAGTPQEVVDILNRAVNAGLADPGVKARLAEVGATPLVYSPDEIRTVVENDTKRWAKVVQAAGIQPE
jgi:tripartite-type tricarboxylate transporter receptor subunit TctC